MVWLVLRPMRFAERARNISFVVRKISGHFPDLAWCFNANVVAALFALPYKPAICLSPAYGFPDGDGFFPNPARYCSWHSVLQFIYGLGLVFSHRACTALRAASLRSFGVMLAALAGPPFFPPILPNATAAGFFFFIR
jgi:hypothetical protein